MRERLRAAASVVAICVRADPWRNAANFIGTIAQQLVPTVTAVALAGFVQGVSDRDLDPAVRGAIVMGAIWIATEVLYVFSTRIDMRTRETGGHALESHLLDLMSSIPGVEHLEDPEHADKILLLQNAKWMLAGIVPALVYNLAVVVQIGVTALLLARVSPWFLFLAAAGVPTLWATSRSTRLQEKISEALAETSRVQLDLQKVATEAKTAGEVRLFGLDTTLRDRHRALWADIDRALTRLALRTQLVENSAWLVFAAAFIGCLALVASRARRGEAAVGDVVLTLTLGTNVRTQLAQASRFGGWLVTCLKAADRYAWITGRAKESASTLTPAEPRPVPPALARGIELRDVSFRYPGTSADVLSDVNLLLPAGSTVAIVGDNGAGKSTLVKLLARFYEPTVGAIYVDDVPLTSIPVEEWRAHVSAGFQDFTKPELAAGEVVGIGYLPDLESVPAIERALLRGAGADLPASLPDGLRTQVGRTFPGGVELSGGQWQKLALGRSMMREAPLLLLLDEPTAALDARASTNCSGASPVPPNGRRPKLAASRCWSATGSARFVWPTSSSSWPMAASSRRAVTPTSLRPAEPTQNFLSFKLGRTADPALCDRYLGATITRAERGRTAIAHCPIARRVREPRRTRGTDRRRATAARWLPGRSCSSSSSRQTRGNPPPAIPSYRLSRASPGTTRRAPAIAGCARTTPGNGDAEHG
ncbi:MAG: ABC transporter ATP-binding protein [Actinobacteria bacterium]|nr:ABC transporter ATP-binding protein [Actinomycetota bacterium]